MYCIQCGVKNDAEYSFCVNCGAPLKPAPPQQQEPQPAEIAAPPPAEPTRSNQPAQLSPPPYSPEPPRPTGPKINWKKWAPIAGVSALVLLIGILLFRSVFATAINTMGPGDPLVYTVQETGVSSPIVAVMKGSSNKQDASELYSDSDGVTLAANFFRPLNLERSYLSPDKKMFAMVEADNKAIVLLPLNGDEPSYVTIDDEENSGILPLGFSPNSKYLAYLSVGYNAPDDIAVVVVDMDGDEIATIDGYLFGDFLSNSRQMVLQSLDYSDSSSGMRYEGSYELVDIETGDVDSILADFESPEYQYGVPSTFFLSSNGDTLYYTDEDSLYMIPTRGGDNELLYESNGYLVGMALERSGDILVLDVDTENSDADLYVIDPDRADKTRIDKYINISTLNNSLLYGAPVVISPNGRQIMYSVKTNDGYSELYVSGIDGKDRVMLASGSGGYRFAFSPDGKKAAYVEAYFDSPGDLYITDLTGKKKTRLDDEVWSFQFTSGGSVVYTRVEDLDRGRPESEIIRIGVNGKGRKVLLESDDGLYTLISNQ